MDIETVPTTIISPEEGPSSEVRKDEKIHDPLHPELFSAGSSACVPGEIASCSEELASLELSSDETGKLDDMKKGEVTSYSEEAACDETTQGEIDKLEDMKKDGTEAISRIKFPVARAQGLCKFLPEAGCVYEAIVERYDNEKSGIVRVHQNLYYINLKTYSGERKAKDVKDLVSIGNKVFIKFAIDGNSHHTEEWATVKADLKTSPIPETSSVPNISTTVNGNNNACISKGKITSFMRGTSALVSDNKRNYSISLKKYMGQKNAENLSAYIKVGDTIFIKTVNGKQGNINLEAWSIVEADLKSNAPQKIPPKASAVPKTTPTVDRNNDTPVLIGTVLRFVDQLSALVVHNDVKHTVSLKRYIGLRQRNNLSAYIKVGQVVYLKFSGTPGRGDTCIQQWSTDISAFERAKINAKTPVKKDDKPVDQNGIISATPCAGKISIGVVKTVEANCAMVTFTRKISLPLALSKYKGTKVSKTFLSLIKPNDVIYATFFQNNRQVYVKKWSDDLEQLKPGKNAPDVIDSNNVMKTVIQTNEKKPDVPTVDGKDRPRVWTGIIKCFERKRMSALVTCDNRDHSISLKRYIGQRKEGDLSAYIKVGQTVFLTFAVRKDNSHVHQWSTDIGSFRTENVGFESSNLQKSVPVAIDSNNVIQKARKEPTSNVEEESTVTNLKPVSKVEEGPSVSNMEPSKIYDGKVISIDGKYRATVSIDKKQYRIISALFVGDRRYSLISTIVEIDDLVFVTMNANERLHWSNNREILSKSINEVSPAEEVSTASEVPADVPKGPIVEHLGIVKKIVNGCQAAVTCAGKSFTITPETYSSRDTTMHPNLTTFLEKGTFVKLRFYSDAGTFKVESWLPFQEKKKKPEIEVAKREMMTKSTETDVPVEVEVLKYLNDESGELSVDWGDFKTQLYDSTVFLNKHYMH